MSNALPAEAEQIAGHSHRRRPWYRILYVQVLIAVAIGIAIGFFFPEFGKALKPLGDGFIKLVKMIIAPIIFCTVVHGIASMRDGKKLGRLGIKTLVYFEEYETIVAALQREKNIKHWSREWKIDLIVAGNPDWRDLYEDIVR